MDKIAEKLTPDLLNVPIGQPGIKNILPSAANDCADDAPC
jgi:hypothetical protein